MAGETVKIRWTLDYGNHLHALAEEAIAQDREHITAYGAILEETKQDKGVIIYVVEYGDSDGWDARGQVEETSAQIGNHADYERIA